MRKRINKWKWTIVLLIYSFFPSLSVFANQISDELRNLLPKEDLEPRVLAVMDKNDFTYQEGVKYLDRFTSKLWVPSQMFGFSAELNYLINSFVQAIFWANKQLFYIFSEIYRNLTGASDTTFNEYVTVAINSSKGIYDGLYEMGIVPFLGAVAAGYAAYIFFFRNGDFVRTLLKFFMVYATTILIFTRTTSGNYLIQDVYDKAQKFSSEFVAASVTALNKQNNVSEKGQKLSGVDSDAELQQYFNISVWKPYEAMNSEGDTDVSESELVSLLRYDSGNDTFEFTDKDGKKVKIGDFVGKEDDVAHPRLSIEWGSKFSYAIGSLFDTVILGVILDAFAITSFTNTIFVIGLILLAGFLSVISLVPRMENTIFSFSKKMVTSIFLINLTQVGSIMALWLYSMLYSMASSIFNNPLVEALAKTAVMVLLWRKRDSVLSMLTAGQVTHLARQFSRTRLGRFNPTHISRRRRGFGSMGYGRPSVRGRRSSSRPTSKFHEFGVGVAKLGLAGAGLGLARAFAPQLQAAKTAKMAVSTGKLGQVGRKVLNLKDGAINKLDEIRSVGVNQKKDPRKRQYIQEDIARRKERMEDRKRINDRLSGKRPVLSSVPLKESPELKKYRAEKLKKHRNRIERRKMNIKSYAKEQVQKQHNEATKKRLLKQRSKRLGQEVVMP
ncbi:hypothetical protein, partial [Streptococcus suis]